VVRREVARVRSTAADRAWLAALSSSSTSITYAVPLAVYLQLLRTQLADRAHHGLNEARGVVEVGRTAHSGASLRCRNACRIRREAGWSGP
jgi:hypothetical protein